MQSQLLTSEKAVKLEVCHLKSQGIYLTKHFILPLFLRSEFPWASSFGRRHET